MSFRGSIGKANEGVRVEEAPFCLLCRQEGVTLYEGLRDRLFRAVGTWSLMYCPKCDLVWLNPRPFAGEVAKLYGEYYTHQAESPSKSSSKKPLANLRRAIKATILQTSFNYSMDVGNGLLGRVLSWIGPLKDIVGASIMYLRAIDRGRLLDIGCGNGRFLADMRELGWEVMGIEPDPEAVRIAKERFGLEVFQGRLEEAKLPDNNFDAITINHVIEHVPDPIGLLAECRRVLRPGGKLVVVTPNIKSLGRRLFHKAWLHWDPPRHLFLFSPEALRVCAERAGLCVIQLRTSALYADVIWGASITIRREGCLAGGVWQEVSFPTRIVYTIFRLVEYLLSRIRDVGEEIVMIAGK